MSIENYISQVLNFDNDNSYEIISYFTVKNLDETTISKYINKLFKTNDILKKYISSINECYEINYIVNADDYHLHLNKALNNPLSKNDVIYFIFCINRETKDANVIIKACHAHFDGYTLMNMLVKNTIDEDIKFKINRNDEKSQLIQHKIIGTILLFFMELFIILKFIFLKFFDIYINCFFGNINNKNNDRKINYIVCNSLDLNKVKKFVKNKNITINDFLYSLMIKTDKLYNNINKNIHTGVPFNISKMNDKINFCLLLNITNNSYDNAELLKTVHDRFDNFKYSLFVPIYSSFMNFITQFIDINNLFNIYSMGMEYIDYSFSNIIGPSKEELTKIQFGDEISNMRFFMRPKSNEIIYSIISSNNDINISLSFKNGVIKNEEDFKNCINKAYDDLINL
jgi:hypothetical protein